MTVTLPADKMRGIQANIARVLQRERIGLKVLSQLLGKLVAMKPAVMTGSLHYRALQHLKITMMKSAQTEATITPEA